MLHPELYPNDDEEDETTKKQKEEKDRTIIEGTEKQIETHDKVKERIENFQEQRKKGGGGRGRFNNKGGIMHRWSQKERRKEAEDVINENKYSALEKNEEVEEATTNNKEDAWMKDIPRE